MQRDTFLATEGDAYYGRNASHLGAESRPLVSSLRGLNVRPKRVLEVGCSNGHVLEILQAEFGCQCHGIDPSREAIEAGRKRARGLQLSVGTANKLEFQDDFFDLVVFGFCLYLCDPQDHFRIAAEADRVLRDGGFVAVYDFYAASPYRNEYRHRLGMFSFKMDYSRMSLWHPAYRLLSRAYSEHATLPTLSRDEAVVLDILHKDIAQAFPRVAQSQTPKANG